MTRPTVHCLLEQLCSRMEASQPPTHLSAGRPCGDQQAGLRQRAVLPGAGTVQGRRPQVHRGKHSRQHSSTAQHSRGLSALPQHCLAASSTLLATDSSGAAAARLCPPSLQVSGELGSSYNDVVAPQAGCC
jgi:hypothetical protein